MITGIIGPLQNIADVIRAAGNPPATELACGLTIIPLGRAQLSSLMEGRPSERVEGFDELSQGLEQALAALATRGPFAYIETFYFGGSGGQGAVLFSPGSKPKRMTEPPLGPINLALRSLGVEARPGSDEFDTVGLGPYRNLKRLGLEDDWKNDKPPILEQAVPPVLSKPQSGLSAKPKRKVGCLVSLVVALLVCGAGLAWMTGYLPVQLFDSGRWKNPETHYTRVRMVSALLLTHDLKGMTKSEVVELLGQPPESTYFRDWDFVYHLGPERGFIGIDSEWLVLRFGPDERVSEWAIVRD